MILFVCMTLNASYYVFDSLTVDDVKIVTIIVLCKYDAPFVMTLQRL